MPRSHGRITEIQWPLISLRLLIYEDGYRVLEYMGFGGVSVSDIKEKKPEESFVDNGPLSKRKVKKQARR